jgi:hypothetical protein
MNKFLMYNELNAVKKGIIKKINKDFNASSRMRVYDSLVNILKVMNSNSIKVVRLLSTIKPIYKIQTIYDLLYEFVGEKELVQSDFL